MGTVAEHSPGSHSHWQGQWAAAPGTPTRSVCFASGSGALFVPAAQLEQAASLHTCRTAVRLRLTRQGPCWQAVPGLPAGASSGSRSDAAQSSALSTDMGQLWLHEPQTACQAGGGQWGRGHGGRCCQSPREDPREGLIPHPWACWQRGKGQRWGCGTHSGKVRTNFGFSNPETSLRMARVPDVLLKAHSLGSPWDGYSSKSAWPSLALCGGLAPCFGKLHNPGQCPAAPSAAAQPSSVPQPRLLEAAEKARVWDRTPLGPALTPPCVSHRSGLVLH